MMRGMRRAPGAQVVLGELLQLGKVPAALVVLHPSLACSRPQGPKFEDPGWGSFVVEGFEARCQDWGVRFGGQTC